MATILANPADLATRLGVDFDTLAEGRARAALEDVTTLVLDEARDAGAAWTIDNVPPMVRLVVIQAALRLRRNYLLDGATQVARDGLSETFAADPAELTPVEKRQVRKAAGVILSSSIDLVGLPIAPYAEGYVPVSNGGDPLPFWPPGFLTAP